MNPRADLAVYNPEGKLTLVAEVKAMTGTSAEWAAQLRRNHLAHTHFAEPNYFLLATPDRLYLWKHSTPDSDGSAPSYIADAREILRPYFEQTNLNPREISGPAFELLIATWLNDVARLKWQPKQPVEEQFLLESGFQQAVQNGRVEFESAA